MVAPGVAVTFQATVELVGLTAPVFVSVQAVSLVCVIAALELTSETPALGSRACPVRTHEQETTASKSMLKTAEDIKERFHLTSSFGATAWRGQTEIFEAIKLVARAEPLPPVNALLCVAGSPTL